MTLFFCPSISCFLPNLLLHNQVTKSGKNIHVRKVIIKEQNNKSNLQEKVQLKYSVYTIKNSPEESKFIQN